MSLIFTNHVRDRIRDRHMSVSQVENTYYSPDEKHPGKEPGTTMYRKRYGHQTVTLIASQNEKREWIAISAWIDPPNVGTQDAKKKAYWKEYKRAGFWGKFWVLFKQSIGI